VTAAYGAYVASVSGCATCHGAGLTGGKDPDPKAPPAPDLTPSSELASWSETQFIAAFRTGMTPNGRTLSDSMPWKDFGNMSDEKLKALWLYLKSLPPK
jgi:cytochrome c553